MKAEDIAMDSMKALDEQLKMVTEFDAVQPAEKTEVQPEESVEKVEEKPLETDNSDDDIKFTVRADMAAKVAAEILGEYTAESIAKPEEIVGEIDAESELESEDESGFFTQSEPDEKTDAPVMQKEKAAKRLKIRRILAIICYTLCLVAYGISGWLAYTTYSKEMSFVQGILTFLPVWITTYWFSTFFADLVEMKQDDGSYKFLINKRTRKFMNNFLYVLGLVFIGIWIYLYITQYLTSANNNNVQLTL